MIAVIEYGVGNLFSLKASLDKLGLNSVVTSDSEVIKNADRIILPGVGAFSDARKKLALRSLDELLVREAEKGKPLLGICLGMQMLFEKSYEYGVHTGLKLIDGIVAPLKNDLPSGYKVPHIGWNALNIVKDCGLLKYNSDGEYVYYVHSFYAKNCEKFTAAVSDYGIGVTGTVCKDNVFGTQFHPEKSGGTGLKMLKAFSEIN